MHGSFREGNFVQVNENTYNLVWPGDATTKKRKKSAKPKRKPASKVDGWYLSLDAKQIVNQNGSIISTKVVILKHVITGHHEQLYIRFIYKDVVWSGYTLKSPPRKIKARATKFNYLVAPGKTTGKAPKLTCSCGKVLHRHSKHINCQACRTKKCNKNVCKTKGCCKQLSRHNESGFCNKCFKQSTNAKAGGRRFNPWLNRSIIVKQES